MFPCPSQHIAVGYEPLPCSPSFGPANTGLSYLRAAAARVSNDKDRFCACQILLSTVNTHTARSVNHSEILSRNMRAARPAEAQPPQTATHHIVARADQRAARGRRLLFQCSIGINDADNGCWLPMTKTSSVACMPNAMTHSGLHTTKYHLKVTLRLTFVDDQDTARKALRDIKDELVDGTSI